MCRSPTTYLASVNNGPVACAAAQVSIEALDKGSCGRLLSRALQLVELGVAGHHKAWCAEATLGGAVGCKSLCDSNGQQFRCEDLDATLVDMQRQACGSAHKFGLITRDLATPL